MAYPPTIPPATRNNTTPQADNHPNDHNGLSNALSDILTELGLNPSQASANLTALLAFLTYDPAATGVNFAIPTGSFTVNIAGGAAEFVVSAAAAILTVPFNSLGVAGNLACGGDVSLQGDGVPHRLMIGATSPWQMFKDASGLHFNVDGADMFLFQPGAFYLTNSVSITSSPPGNMALAAPNGNIQLATVNNGTVNLRSGVGAGAQLTVSNNSITLNGVTVADGWNNRLLILDQTAGAGQCGIGFRNQANGATAQLYVYNQPTLAFDFRNDANTAWIPLRASAFSVSSSARFKEHIEPWGGDALDTIDRLIPSTYERDGQPELGLIAEQVDEVFPIAVGHDAEGPALLDVQQLVVLALAGIAELNRRLS